MNYSRGNVLQGIGPARASTFVDTVNSNVILAGTGSPTAPKTPVFDPSGPGYGQLFGASGTSKGNDATKAGNTASGVSNASRAQVSKDDKLKMLAVVAVGVALLWWVSQK